jgi:hypothetical protein
MSVAGGAEPRSVTPCYLPIGWSAFPRRAFQHTQRFGAVAHLVGHALGGRGGERLLARLGMGISDDTILRLLKRATAAALAPNVLRVVGIDDWAWRKGQHHYGTILVDLERRAVVDVLPVRTANAVATCVDMHLNRITVVAERKIALKSYSDVVEP